MVDGLNGHVRAGYGAYSAADTFGRFMHLSIKVPFQINLPGHGNNLHRAGVNTQLTTLAIILIYSDTGHILFLRDFSPPVGWFCTGFPGL